MFSLPLSNYRDEPSRPGRRTPLRRLLPLALALAAGPFFLSAACADAAHGDAAHGDAAHGDAVTSPDSTLATIGGQTITQKDVDQLVGKDYREAAIKRLIRKSLIDAMAARANISVTDADADQAVTKWKKEVLGGDESRYQVELGRQGLTASLYREVVREGMIADLMVAKPTRLVNADYDQQRIQPLYVKTLDDAIQAYLALQKGESLVNVIREYSVKLLPMFTVWRYDSRFSRADLNSIWGGDRADHLAPEIGSFIKPIPSTDPPGYEILQIKEQTPGTALLGADRDAVTPMLLQQKISLRLQDWWAALEKQVSVIYAGVASGTPPVVAAESAAPVPTDGASAPGGGVVSIKLLPGPDKQPQ